MYKQIAIILGICLAADCLAYLLPVALPSNMLGMLLLLILLLGRLVKLESVEAVCDGLVKNMPILFIPSSCSLINTYGVLAKNLLPFFLICVVTTLITFSVTAGTINLVVKLQQRGKTNKKVGAFRG